MSCLHFFLISYIFLSVFLNKKLKGVHYSVEIAFIFSIYSSHVLKSTPIKTNLFSNLIFNSDYFSSRLNADYDF